MNEEQSPCASSDPTPEWDRLEWSHYERQVRRLQARIVKATRERRWGKVKSLQWLLTHSFSGKALAVNRVTENKGKNTPGVDGEVWQSPGGKYQAIGSLQRRGYQPKPLRRVYIPKSNGKLRPLGIPAMIDRAMQGLHLLALEPVAETTGDPNSYGFRKARSTADAIEQARCVLHRQDKAQWVLEGDIKGCFDNISHGWMLTNLPTDASVLGKWLRSGFMENGIWFPTAAGTPQGGIISPTAANMTLDGLEQLLRDRFVRRKGPRTKYYNPKVNLVRYADDFIITGESQELLAQEVRPLVERFLNERGLQLSPEKTKITHTSQGFDFLGQNLRKHGQKLIVTPSKKNVHAFLEKVRTILHNNSSVTQDQLIWQLNPVLRGWANYHRHSSATKVFGKLDRLIWYSLWQWAKRRHPTRPARWVAKKYWHNIGGRQWTFAAETGKRMADGKPIWNRMIRLSETRLCRHIKIKMDANPFDPHWGGYFEARATLLQQHTPIKHRPPQNPS